MPRHLSDLSDEERNALYKDFPDYTNPELEEKYGITITSAANAGRRQGLKKTKETRRRAYQARELGIDDEQIDPIEEHTLKERVRTLESDLRRQVAKRAWTQELVDALSAQIPSITATPLQPRRVASGTKKEMCLVISDQHGGSHISASESGGIGAYDKHAFLARAQQLIDAVTQVKHRHDPSVRRLPIFSLGDNNEGRHIYRGQTTEIDWNLAQQLIHVPEVMARVYVGLLSSFEEIHVYSVPGNHGRVTFSAKEAVQPTENFDWVITRIAEQLTRTQKRIVWHIPETWFQLVERLGFRFLLIHGDTIRSWGGTPQNAVMRNAAKFFELIQAHLPRELSGRAFHYMCLGHFHTRAWIESTGFDVIMNGAWPGGSMYSARQLKSSSLPSQTLFSVHPEHGVTDLWPIYLASREGLPKVDIDAR